MIKVNSKSCVVAPEWLLKLHPSNSVREFSHGVARMMGWRCVSYEDFDPTELGCNSFVFSACCPSFVFEGKKLYDLPLGIRVVYWMDDCQWRTETERSEIRNMLERADLVLAANKIHYLTLWSEYAEKMRWLPLYAPDEFLKYKLNPSPVMKCLLSGRNGTEKLQHKIECGHWYPVRFALASKYHSEDWLVIQEHPGYKVLNAESAGPKFADLLHSYFCCVTDSACTYGTMRYDVTGRIKFSDEYISEVTGCHFEGCKVHGQVIKKYFEIPATGSLLIADDHTPDMRELGFVPYHNFVPVTPESASDVIKDCISRPDDFTEIRNNGMRLVRENHTLAHRLSEFNDLFEDFTKRRL